jgi:hypothetical protein
MDLVRLTFQSSTGWSAPLPSSLDSPSTLVIAFGASGLLDDGESVRELRRALPRALLIGCSTAGEIHGTSLLDGSVSAAVVRFAGTTLRGASAPVRAPGDSFAAGQSIASSLAGPGLKGIFILSDGLHVNGSELVRGLNSSLPRDVVVTGGLAGDGDRFQRTWVTLGGELCDQVVAAVGFYGDRVRLGHGSKGGWDLFGPQRLITRSEGNALFELDRRPALDLYKEYLGEQAAGLPAAALLFPLALRMPDSPDRSVVRTVLSIDEDRQSMVFAGDVPQGAYVQLMRANFDRLIDGASGAAGMVRMSEDAAHPVLAVAISCVGRRLVLKERTEEELEAALDVLPVGTEQIGFYSYGEISPYATGDCDLHNQTMTLTTIAEGG